VRYTQGAEHSDQGSSTHQCGKHSSRWAVPTPRLITDSPGPWKMVCVPGSLHRQRGHWGCWSPVQTLWSSHRKNLSRWGSLHKNAEILPNLPMTFKWHIVCHAAEGDISLEWGGVSAKGVYFLWPRTWVGVIAYSDSFPAVSQASSHPSCSQKTCQRAGSRKRSPAECSAN